MFSSLYKIFKIVLPWCYCLIYQNDKEATVSNAAWWLVITVYHKRVIPAAQYARLIPSQGR